MKTSVGKTINSLITKARLEHIENGTIQPDPYRDIVHTSVLYSYIRIIPMGSTGIKEI